MDFAKVVAIIKPEMLKKVEEKLLTLDVPGISVRSIKGYGEYENFFRPDHLDEHIQVDVFIGYLRATEIAEAILEAAHSGSEGDGIVAIIPVESVYHIRTKKKCGNQVC